MPKNGKKKTYWLHNIGVQLLSSAINHVMAIHKSHTDGIFDNEHTVRWQGIFVWNYSYSIIQSSAISTTLST